MFLDYLKNRKTEVEAILSEKNKLLTDIDIKIRENQKLFELIENGKSTPFTEFTPQVISTSDKKKQQSLMEEESILQSQKNDILSDITKLDIELENIEAAISDAKSRFAKIKRAQTIEKKEIVSRINKILDRNISDPMRSNIELKELLKFIENND